MPLPFSNLDIITIEGKKLEVSMDHKDPNFCNLYEPGKPHTYDYNEGQLMLHPSSEVIIYTKPHRARLHFLGKAPFYEFGLDYFLSSIEYPQKPQ
jgi:hypothetical protein